MTADPGQAREDHTVALVAEAGAPAVGKVGREGLERGQWGPGGGQAAAKAPRDKDQQEQQEERCGGRGHPCDMVADLLNLDTCISADLVFDFFRSIFFCCIFSIN